MATNYNKYINSTGTHYISNSGSDENGNLHGGKTGDQNGKEWRLRSWYSRPWTSVLRHPDATVRRMIAEYGIDAALNDKIGYDQWQRYSYWDALTKSGYAPKNVKTACEADCTAGVTANVKAIGKVLNIPKLYDIEKDTRSGNMRARFKTADFKVLTDKKYLTSPDYLLPGDILLYDNHHAATNITKGKKAAEPAQKQTAQNVLKRGDKGAAVLSMQNALLKWNADILPKYGADADFGAETEKALKAFQIGNELPVTGVLDAATKKALDNMFSPAKVRVTGATVNLRQMPSTGAAIVAVLAAGTELEYIQTSELSGKAWHLVRYDGGNYWISGKYSEVIK